VRFPGRSLALGAALLLAGCGDARRDATRTVQAIGPAPLRRDAAAFHKQLFAAPPARYFLPRPSHWPASFTRLKPLRVRAYPDGFALALRERRGLEEGLYLIPLGMELAPRQSRAASFSPLAEGIYWYAFTD